jgi:FkbM family methyltransferase
MIQIFLRIPVFKRLLPHIYKSYLSIFKIKNTEFKFEDIIFDLDTRHLIDRHFYFTKSYEELDYNYLCHTIEKFDIKTFIDVGACWGLYSLRISNRFKLINVYSYEPIKKNINRLKKSILKNNFFNIKIINAAVGNNDGEIVLNVDSNFSPNYYFSPYFNGKKKIFQKETCKVKKIDSTLAIKGKNLALKIDVEGYEFEVLKGAKNLLTNNRCIILIEICGNKKEEILDYFESISYSLKFRSEKNGANYFFSNL